MPKPRQNETRDEFISRCMSVVSKESDKRDWPRRRMLGYCNGLWRQERGESSEELKFTVAGERNAYS